MNQPEILKNPLAYNGDKSILPDEPVTDSSQFSLSEGFPLLSATPKKYGGIAPKREDFNSIAYLLSLHTLFLQSGNKYKYSPLLDYNIGATVLGSDNALYYCIKDNNADNPHEPITSTDYWIELINKLGEINGKIITDRTLDLTTKVTNILSIANGGTGANTPQNATNNLLGNLDINTTISPDDYIYVYIEDTVKKITLSNLSNYIVPSLPIGFIYMQLRGQKTPDVLFKTSGKWQDISNTYAGRFFRVAGGSAAAFGSQQGGGLPNIAGDIKGFTGGAYNDNFSKLTSNRAFRTTNHSRSEFLSFERGGYLNRVNILFNANYSNNIYGAANEVRPINETIRIWRKVA